jgi:uncharacterized protein (TIGR00299 family) protein
MQQHSLGDLVGGTFLYLDPWSGISGDMLMASLLDAGRDVPDLDEVLQHAVGGLGLAGAQIDIVRGVEWGLTCTRVEVRGEHQAPLRHLQDMERIIASAALSEGVAARALSALRRLASVEASIHGCSPEEIHFHEVGAVDTLVDVVGTFVLVEALGIERVGIGTIPVGGGTVTIAHGRMGIPAPATAKLLEGYQIVGGPEMRELTTPTGALLVAELGAEQGSLPPMRVDMVGYGAGSMKLEGGPNVLRTLIGRMSCDDGEEGQAIVELETNLDDVPAEVVGYASRILRELGAVDVWTVAAVMKKDRPGVVLHVLVPAELEEAAVMTVFSETGTLGVRRQEKVRRVAERGTVAVTVAGEPVRVKWGRWQGRLTSLAPEYEDAVKAAKAGCIPLKEVMGSALEAARAEMGKDER